MLLTLIDYPKSNKRKLFREHSMRSDANSGLKDIITNLAISGVLNDSKDSDNEVINNHQSPQSSEPNTMVENILVILGIIVMS